MSFIIEAIRRFAQICVGFEIFEFPGLSLIRNFTYRILFKIGSNPVIGKNVRLFRVHGIRANDIEIGDNVLLANNVNIDYVGGVTIGDNVWLSEGVHIHTHSHLITPNRVNRPMDEIIPNSLEIKNNVWLGDGVKIMPSVSYIGENSIVGAGSIVTKDVADNVIVAGNPAKLIKTLAL